MASTSASAPASLVSRAVLLSKKYWHAGVSGKSIIRGPRWRARRQCAAGRSCRPGYSRKRNANGPYGSESKIADRILHVAGEVTAMATCYQFALSNPVPGQEEEFNRWYGTDHLIHGVLTPGILAGQRFRRSEGPWPSGKHDYLTIWEIDDPAYALAQLAKARGSDAMPISPSADMSTLQPPTHWRRATLGTAAGIATSTSERGMLALMLANAAAAEAEAFEGALLRGGLGALADLPGVISAELLTPADEQIRGSAKKYAYAVLLELHDEGEALASLADRVPALPHLDRERWFAVVFRPLGHRLTTSEARRAGAEPG